MKKLYIWERVDECSDRYHSEGGVIAIGKTEKEAREKANERIKALSYLEDDIVGIREDEPADHWMPLVKHVDFEVIIFPDAGCC